MDFCYWIGLVIGFLFKYLQRYVHCVIYAIGFSKNLREEYVKSVIC